MELLPGDVKKALDLLRAEAGPTLDISETARRCGVARRTLEKHFRRYLGSSFAEVRRQIRLDQTRQDLLAASADTSVTNVALKRGFNHLGRFAAAYRAKFGESPVQTLQHRQATNHLNPCPSPLGLRPERPSVAVARFEFLSGGTSEPVPLAEEIAVRLCNSRQLVLHEPDRARYVLQGKVVARHDRRIRALLMLLDGRAGRYIWADHWDGDTDDCAAFCDRAAARAARAIERSVWQAEVDQAYRKQPEHLTSWELVMRALPLALAINAPAQAQALELLDQARELSPHDPLPIALAAWCHGHRSGHHFTTHPLKEQQAAHDYARLATPLASGDALAMAVLASAFTLAHDLPAAAAHFERALALDGGCVWAWIRSGWVHVYRGEVEEAHERFRIANYLEPNHPLHYFCTIGSAAAHFEAGRYREAAEWFGRGLAEHPSAVWVNRFRAPAYALAGEQEIARHCVTDLRRHYPDLTVAAVRSALPHTSKFLDQAADGLERAGLPV